MKKKIAILGSTGSIGTQALDVVRSHREMFDVCLLTANSNASLLASQAGEFNAGTVVIGNREMYGELSSLLGPTGTAVYAGNEVIPELLSDNGEIDTVIAAMTGFSGLMPTLAALKAGKTVAIANKETLVAAGAIVMETARTHNASIIPVDSEHSAIFQVLQGEHSPIGKILLTASGGPFLRIPASEMAAAGVHDALNHPKWKMGRKVTIDSATLMNKGFEVIEAGWLFDVPVKDIEVVIHPQSIIHSMVAFMDGSVLAQMSVPDMRIPIQYALTYPERMPSGIPQIDFCSLGGFTFASPDTGKFPCLSIAYEAAAKGGNIPCAMNAADEIAVEAFLQGRITLCDIPGIIADTIAKCTFIQNPDIDGIISTDSECRRTAESIIGD